MVWHCSNFGDCRCERKSRKDDDVVMSQIDITEGRMNEGFIGSSFSAQGIILTVIGIIALFILTFQPNTGFVRCISYKKRVTIFVFGVILILIQVNSANCMASGIDCSTQSWVFSLLMGLMMLLMVGVVGVEFMYDKKYMGR